MKAENNKWKNILIIILLSIIIGLIGFIVYDKVLSKDIKEETNNTNNETKLSEDDARKIVKEKAKMVFNYANALTPYCGERSENDYIGNDESQRWYASTTYANKNELLNYLRTFMSDEVINEYSQEKVWTEPIFKEENNKLYCYSPGIGGGNHYIDGKSSYQILNVTENSIDAIGNIFFTNYDEMRFDTTVIRLEKSKNDNWVMVSYAPILNGRVENITQVESYLEKVIFVNKTNSEYKIVVHYNGKDFIDSKEIEKIKTEIHSIHSNDIDVYIEYDDIGYIKKVVISPISY